MVTGPTFANKLIVSCQDHEKVMLRAAKDGGAAGFRVNGLNALEWAREVDSDMPVIACWKRFRRGKLRITPDVAGACKLAKAGAELVAFDACRSVIMVGDMIAAIHEHGALAVADIDDGVSGCVAIDAGADYVATTLAPRLSRVLIQGLGKAGGKVIAEGHIDTPEQAKQCIEWGASLVVVGTAITRPKTVTKRFLEAVEGAGQRCGTCGAEDRQMDTPWMCIGGTSSRICPKCVQDLRDAGAMEAVT